MISFLVCVIVLLILLYYIFKKGEEPPYTRLLNGNHPPNEYPSDIGDKGYGYYDPDIASTLMSDIIASSRDGPYTNNRYSQQYNEYTRLNPHCQFEKYRHFREYDRPSWFYRENPHLLMRHAEKTVPWWDN